MLTRRAWGLFALLTAIGAGAQLTGPHGHPWMIPVVALCAFLTCRGLVVMGRTTAAERRRAIRIALHALWRRCIGRR